MRLNKEIRSLMLDAIGAPMDDIMYTMDGLILQEVAKAMIDLAVSSCPKLREEASIIYPEEFKKLPDLLTHKHPKATRLTKLRWGALLK